MFKARGMLLMGSVTWSLMQQFFLLVLVFALAGCGVAPDLERGGSWYSEDDLVDLLDSKADGDLWLQLALELDICSEEMKIECSTQFICEKLADRGRDVSEIAACLQLKEPLGGKGMYENTAVVLLDTTPVPLAIHVGKIYPYSKTAITIYEARDEYGDALEENPIEVDEIKTMVGENDRIYTAEVEMGQAHAFQYRGGIFLVEITEINWFVVGPATMSIHLFRLHGKEGWSYLGPGFDADQFRFESVDGTTSESWRAPMTVRALGSCPIREEHFDDFDGTWFEGSVPDINGWIFPGECARVTGFESVGFNKIWLRLEKSACPGE